MVVKFSTKKVDVLPKMMNNSVGSESESINGTYDLNVGVTKDILGSPNIGSVGHYRVSSENLNSVYNIFNKTTGENNMATMSQRKKVKVTLIDNDQSLDLAYSLVFEDEFMTDTTCRETIIQEVLISNDIKGAIVKHNKVRGEQIDQSILKNTGREVKLRPIKLRELTWNIQ